jgi:hypothetical protein
MRDFPLVEYAKKIGKNTAEFTIKDLTAFMKWWLKQQPREDLLKMASNYKQDLAAMQAFRKRESEEEVEETVKGNVVADSVVVGEEVVCSMELTRADVEALLFSISRTFADYEMEEDHPHTISLTGLQEGLKGV